MIVRGVAEYELSNALRRTSDNLVIKNLRREGTGVAFVLRTKDSRGQYARISRYAEAFGGKPRRTSSVCFHGFHAFLQNLFAMTPNAVAISAIARYTSKEDLEEKALKLSRSHVGGAMPPLAFADCCNCVKQIL